MSVVDVSGLVKHFPIDKGIVFPKIVGHVKAVDGISFSIESGRTLGLVGESGSGKSTTGSMILRLLEPTAGTVRFHGKSVTDMDDKELHAFRCKAQMVFQNPFASLNPRMIVRDIVGRVLKVHGESNDSRITQAVLDILREVGLKEEHMTRYPHEFSGGQRQRIAVARALISNPEFVVLDEPTSALDVSVQAQILNLFKDIQKDRGLSYLFISHDLSVVRHISHDVAVLYLGKTMEYASKNALFASPRHPYTRALLESIPKPFITGEAIEDKVIQGDIPSPMNPPAGCRFHTRCPQADDLCRSEEPLWREVAPKHFVACHQA